MTGILVLGGLMVDRFYMVDRFPQRGQDAIIKRAFSQVGGCAVNMAFTIRNLGGRAHLVSYVGEDAEGSLCLQYLKEKGLPYGCVKTAPGRTGYCMVFVEPDGERTFLTMEGCEGRFTEDLISQDALHECRGAAVTGYYLLGECGDSVLAALERLKQRGVKILLDPSPLVSYIEPGLLNRAVRLADVLTPNREETEVLAAGERPEDWALARSAGEGGPGALVVVKEGAKGGTVYDNGRAFPYKSYPVETADSTGAGDSFAGGLLWALLEGFSSEKAAELAARCAGLTAAMKGPHGEFDTGWAMDWRKDLDRI